MVNIHEIKARFSYFAKQVRKGKSFVIAHRNRPFAVFAPLEGGAGKSAAAVRFGVLKDKFVVPDNFNAPVAEFEEYYYGPRA